MPKRYGVSFSDHIDRYSYALPHCYRKRVLDAGCKDGFGGLILSHTANLIGFADISEHDIGLARKMNCYCPAKFYIIDFEKEPLQDEWDTIVCFETIEHLQDPNLFLASVRDHLVTGGKFIFSVPHMSESQLHKQLYDETKIRELVGKYLPITEFHVQEKKAVSGNPLFHKIKVYVGLATKP